MFPEEGKTVHTSMHTQIKYFYRLEGEKEKMLRFSMRLFDDYDFSIICNGSAEVANEQFTHKR